MTHTKPPDTAYHPGIATSYTFAVLNGGHATYDGLRHTWTVRIGDTVTEVHKPSGVHRWDALLGMYPKARQPESDTDRAQLHVDLANKSCTITGRGGVWHGTWGPGVTRRTAETVIEVGGWQAAPDSTWAGTPDGGTLAVVRGQDDSDAAVHADDALLDVLGGRDTQPAAEPADDLCALLIALRMDADEPMPPLVSTDGAVRAIAAARKRRDRRVLRLAALAAGAVSVPVVALAGGIPVEIALAFPAGAVSTLVLNFVLDRLFGGTR